MTDGRLSGEGMASGDWKIYTKKGDTGQTRLLSGETVAKDDLRVKTYGCLDELQAHLGMVRAVARHEPIRSVLYAVQQDIFAAASELASTSQQLPNLRRRIGRLDIERLERQIDEWTARYGLPAQFVVAGRSVDSSAAHVARTVCRRCERLIIQLNRQLEDYPLLISYFNRLSDLLFVLAWALEVRAIVEAVVDELFCGNGETGEAR